MASTHRTLTRPHGAIAYDVTGTGPLVICVPGMGDLRRTYRHVAPTLAAAGFTVVTMDLRGHGDSSATFDRYDDVAAASDILALIEELGMGPAVVVGNSMGAGAAALAAAQAGDAPVRGDSAGGAVAGIALLGPFVRNAPINPVMAALFRALMWGPWSSAAWTAYLPTLYPTGAPPDLREHRQAIRDSLRRPGYARAFRATTRTDHAPVQARLGDVRCPALVIMGGADPDFPDPAGEATWVMNALGAGTVSAAAHVLDGIGHYPHAEAPEATLGVLLPFIIEAHRG